ncbi:hypothetical protein [Fimbriiglobus ruber]|uniref:Uncharacterized protein n=1 Tax=Fimbriiglobus ruber TaxID=1908690 RepID=A0A225CYE8_9BACT|nr:hypothetical protein [Fimbriiglobus ruber]OWK34262.1 hypothetical protein FRUB_10233 [Fimbriiglobus ruber]
MILARLLLAILYGPSLSALASPNWTVRDRADARLRSSPLGTLAAALDVSDDPERAYRAGRIAAGRCPWLVDGGVRLSAWMAMCGRERLPEHATRFWDACDRRRVLEDELRAAGMLTPDEIPLWQIMPLYASDVPNELERRKPRLVAKK